MYSYLVLQYVIDVIMPVSLVLLIEMPRYIAEKPFLYCHKYNNSMNNLISKKMIDQFRAKRCFSKVVETNRFTKAVAVFGYRLRRSEDKKLTQKIAWAARY